MWMASPGWSWARIASRHASMWRSSLKAGTTTSKRTGGTAADRTGSTGSFDHGGIDDLEPQLPVDPGRRVDLIGAVVLLDVRAAGRDLVVRPARERVRGAEARVRGGRLDLEGERLVAAGVGDEAAVGAKGVEDRLLPACDGQRLDL